MAIPTEASFESFLDTALGYTPPSAEARKIVYGLYGRDPSTVEADEIIPVLLHYYEARQDRLSKLRRSDVSAWLNGQRDYLNAERLMIKGRKNAREIRPIHATSSLLDIAKDHAKGLIQSYMARNDAPMSTERRRNWLAIRLQEYLSVGFDFLFLVNCARALHEYFYDVSSADASIRLSNTFELKLTEAIAAVQRVASEVDQAFQSGFLRPSASQIAWLEEGPKHLRSMATGLKCPITRKSLRARERLFVYRMVASRRAAGHKPKPDVIHLLMGLEGFRHVYDLRTIAGLCAEFGRKEARKETEHTMVREAGKTALSQPWRY